MEGGKDDVKSETKKMMERKEEKEGTGLEEYKKEQEVMSEVRKAGEKRREK